MKQLILLISSILLLAACAPENNSRIGDRYHDPYVDLYQSGQNQENLSLSIEGTGPLSGEAPFEIELQATTNLQPVAVVSWSLLGEDGRSVAEFGDLSGQLLVPRQGNYALQIRVFSDQGVTLSEVVSVSATQDTCLAVADFYAQRIDATIVSCQSCHAGGNPTAQMDFDLSGGTDTEARRLLVDNKLTLDGLLPDYPASNSHGGGIQFSMGELTHTHFEAYNQAVDSGDAMIPAGCI